MTDLWDGKTRLPKDHPRFEALGWGDHLSVIVGRIHVTYLDQPVEALDAFMKDWFAVDAEGHSTKSRLQTQIMQVMSEISLPDGSPPPATAPGPQDLEWVEGQLQKAEQQMGKWSGWAIPGGSHLSLAFDEARVVCRHWERSLCAVPGSPDSVSLQIVNRLSDLFWVLGRIAQLATESSPDRKQHALPSIRRELKKPT